MSSDAAATQRRMDQSSQQPKGIEQRREQRRQRREGAATFPDPFSWGPERARPRMRDLINRFKYPLPSRFPTTAHRVRWVRPAWKKNHAGVPAWSHRWFTTAAGAARLARKLADDGAVVQVDSFNLEHLGTTYVDREAP